jgi:hypothetical protein
MGYLSGGERTVARKVPQPRSRARAKEAPVISHVWILLAEYALLRNAPAEIAAKGRWLHRIGDWRIMLTDRDALVMSLADRKRVAVLTPLREQFGLEPEASVTRESVLRALDVAREALLEELQAALDALEGAPERGEAQP